MHIWTCLQGLMKIQQWLFELLRKQSVTDGRTHGRIWTCLQGLMKIQQWLFELLRKQSVTDGWTDGRTDGPTDGQRENSIPPTNKVCGGIIKNKCVSGNRPENLGRVGIKKKKFSGKNIILYILKGISPFKCIKLYIFSRKPEKNLGFTSKFR